MSVREDLGNKTKSARITPGRAAIFSSLFTAFLFSTLYLLFTHFSAFAFTGPSTSVGVGSGAISVGASDNVGIGTAVPSAGVMLDIRNGSNPNTILQLTGTSLATGQFVTDSSLDLTVKNVSNGRLFFGTNNTTKMTILSGGNVGIGTTGPTSKLTVAGEIYSTSGGIRFPDNTVQTTATAGAGGVIPSGMIALFDTACPATWTRFSALDGRFPQGAALYGATGGSATHSHAIDPPNTGTTVNGDHTHGISVTSVLTQGDSADHSHGFWSHDGGNWVFANTGGESGGHYHAYDRADTPTAIAGAHSHSVDILPFQSDTQSNIPPYLNMMYCKKN